jgi:hypothetical protein
MHHSFPGAKWLGFPRNAHSFENFIVKYCQSILVEDIHKDVVLRVQKDVLRVILESSRRVCHRRVVSS